MIKLLPFFTIFFVISLQAQPFVEYSKNFGCYHHRQHLQNDLAERNPFLNATNERSDTFDILHYDLQISVLDYSGKTISGICEVTLTAKMDNISILNLDLIDLTVDSVWNENGHLDFEHNGLLLSIEFPQPMNSGDESSVKVAYHGKPFNFPDGFGGFYFENEYTYNLSIGITAYPHNFGRAWFPCFDNFVERSTYSIGIITPESLTASFSGEFVSKEDLGNNTSLWRFKSDIPLPTYLVSMAAAKYESIEWDYQGLFGAIPVKILAKARDTSITRTAFSSLNQAIRTFEDWYGEMPWTSVGYTLATKGAMENPSNIIYPEFSVVNSNNSDHRPLMSHELAHQWWGNIVNPKTSMDMWIKEGNAEYGGHMFFERIMGQEVFERVVADNIAEVLKTAHVDDDGYKALSPMPPSHTYGNHTYYKGAAVLHNMRSYLGDSLFALGQKAVLNAYHLGPLDAEEYRDQLTATTGVDMTSFFEDWIFAPGYSNFEIDSVKSAQQGANYQVTVYIQQKLRAAPHFHSEIPVFLNFIDDQFEEHIVKVNVSGEFSEPVVTLPFNPKHVFLNTHQELNIAQLNDTKWLDASQTYNFNNTGFQIKVNEIDEPCFIHVIHHWTAPDKMPTANNPRNFRLSENHYWSVLGSTPGKFDAGTSFIPYDGNPSNAYLDSDLVSITEDSLLLVYRPHAGVLWEEYPYYRKIALVPTDKKGFIQIDSLLLGDYAFANGGAPVVSVKDPEKTALATVILYPNPASGSFTIEGYSSEVLSADLEISLYNYLGQKVNQKNSSLIDGAFKEIIPIAELPSGIYIVRTNLQGGSLLDFQKIITR